jgi:hypothetical protein
MIMSEPDWKAAPEGANQVLFVYYDSAWIESWHADDSEFISKLMLKIQTQPAWRETGDFPPVGTECEYKCDEGFWYPCKIKYAGNPYIIAESNGEELILSRYYKFRPIQSDRDKAIEEMLHIAGWHKSKEGVRFFEKLYDAGFRKPDQDLKSQLIATEVSLENAEMWKGALVEMVNDLTGAVSQAFINQPFPYILHLAYGRATELLGNMEQK